MRKSIEAIKGDRLINIRNNNIVKVEEVLPDKMLIIDEDTQIAKIVAKATIRRWFKMHEEYVKPNMKSKFTDVEYVNTIWGIGRIVRRCDLCARVNIDGYEVDIAYENLSLVEQQEETNTVTFEHSDIIDNGSREETVTDNLNNILNMFECVAIKKKEYLGIYKEGYRGTVCMLRTSKTGNRHIDMKQKVFDSLTSEYKQQLQEKYTCGIYDRSRGYYRIQNCEDINVIQKVIECALQLG